MIINTTMFAVWAALAAPGSAVGSIGGIVVDADSGRPVPEAEVVLRVTIEGRFVPAADTLTDEHGRFRFSGLPASAEYIYLAGANCDGIHYPGSRLQLTQLQPEAEVRLEVCHAVTEPNPLVVRRHEILVEPKPDSLTVRESMIIENPSSTCFVGGAIDGEAEPVTLQLSIPTNFERTTFDREFYGRRFSIAEDGLVTGIPWTPGKRELNFTYVLPLDADHPVWQRTLDLPTDTVEVTVRTDKPEEVVCDLGGPAINDGDRLIFRSQAGVLPRGHLIGVRFGAVPFSWRTYAPWLTLAMLVGLIATASLMIRLRRARNSRADSDRPPESGRHRKTSTGPQAGRRRKRRSRQTSAS